VPVAQDDRLVSHSSMRRRASSGATSSTCTTTPGGAYAANDSVSVSVSITSGGTMNDQVDLQSVSFEYTATQ